jgi:hypothetical protein
MRAVQRDRGDDSDAGEPAGLLARFAQAEASRATSRCR